MILIALATLFALASGGAVLELTPETFDDHVGGNEPILVEFFAPWCGHCKSLAPEYEIAATAFAKLPVKVASVDADKHRDLGSRFGVTGFPTIKFFPSGTKEAEAYNGGRTAKDIVDFLNGKAGTNARIKEAPTAVVVLTDDNFDGIVKDANKNVLVEFYAPWCGHCKKLAPDYEKVATIFASEQDVVIAKMDATEHKKKPGDYGVSGYPTLKWFPKDDKSGKSYDAGRSVEDFVNFINTNAGTQKTKEGGYLPTAGRITEFEDIITRFKAGDKSEKQKLLGELEKKVSAYSGTNKDLAKFYSITAKRVVEKGKIGRAVQQECRDRSRMPSSA
eukprot:TRINITY_DN9937_c0_g1_i26.p1 TRINITY_DN9937_c0_g1~~TRINITY_DN9937_c0_g1_i26.p1  ORF type:complete len:333 (+),score=69.99 TRINITY_DN9937_c0_g1_i26:135-1133(+)